MNRRGFIFGVLGMAAGGAALASTAQAAPAQTLWDELQGLDGAQDLPAEGAEEAQRRHARGHYRGRTVYRHRGYRYPRGRAYGYYWGPRRRRVGWGRRRVCRLVRNRWGYLVRRCFWVW